jgi:hypothetical protein
LKTSGSIWDAGDRQIGYLQTKFHMVDNRAVGSIERNLRAGRF